MDASRGSGRVEICNESAAPIPGFSFDGCADITANAVNHVVRWTGNPALKAIEGKEIRLRFQMKNAKLFAFQFGSQPCESATADSQG